MTYNFLIEIGHCTPTGVFEPGKTEEICPTHFSFNLSDQQITKLSKFQKQMENAEYAEIERTCRVQG